MSWWTDFRDTLETVGVVVANYFYPGTGMLGSVVNSKGSQEQLGSWLGQVAMMGSGVAGAYGGNMSNYGTAMDGLSGGVGAGTTGAGDGSIGSGMNTLANSGSRTYEDLFQQYIQQGATPEEAMSAAQAAAGPTGVTGGAANNAGQMGTGPGFSGTGTMGGGSAGATANNSWLNQGGTVAGKTAGAMPWGSPGNVSSIGSGVLGLMASNQMMQAGRTAQREADPFGPQRQQYADRLAALSADPSSITKMPGYEAGLQAVRRTMAGQGYTGSGNMMAAIAKYGGDFYNQAMQMYSGLAGAQFNPAQGAALGLQGTQAGLGIAGQSLGSMGYGGYMAGNQWPWQRPNNGG